MRWYQDPFLSPLLLEIYDGPGSMEEWVSAELASPADVFEAKHGARHLPVRRLLEDAQEWMQSGL